MVYMEIKTMITDFRYEKSLEIKENKTIKTTDKRLFLVLILFLTNSLSVFAQDTQTFEFGKIWDKIKENSHSQKALSLEARSAKLASNKASKHWLPRVYADARNFTTNDPALNFFSTLGQRSATNSDFATKSRHK